MKFTINHSLPLLFWFMFSKECDYFLSIMDIRGQVFRYVHINSFIYVMLCFKIFIGTIKIIMCPFYTVTNL